jgi:hemoglobin-like flavoprotein
MPARSLTSVEAALVKRSFDRIWPVAGETADRFYRRLFEIAPHLRPMFRADIQEQGRKFIGTLAVLVGNLDDNDQLLSVAGTLGRQHAQTGVQPSHYPLVGAALLWALDRALGVHWTPDTAAAWKNAFEIVSAHMIEQGDTDGCSSWGPPCAQ